MWLTYRVPHKVSMVRFIAGPRAMHQTSIRRASILAYWSGENDMGSQPGQRGPFPVHYAFVVQFAAETSLEEERMRGRVEPAPMRER